MIHVIKYSYQTLVYAFLYVPIIVILVFLLTIHCGHYYGIASH